MARKSKARRGELRIRPATGYVWTERGLKFDPDEAVQQSVRWFLERLQVSPSVWSVARWASDHRLELPTRRCFRDGTSELTWKRPSMSRLYHMFSNPVYAGTYTFGRNPTKQVLINGEIRRRNCRVRDPEQWPICIHDAHPGYISWEQYVSNQQKLRDNQACHSQGKRGAPREGRALLAGMIICARCGKHVCTNYGGEKGAALYTCSAGRVTAQRTCWTVPGEPIDRAVEKLFLQTMAPSEVDLSLAVEREVGVQAASLHKQWKLRLEQAEYEARRAERRYKSVDPDNRVVARTLEREWEESLLEVEQVQRDYEAAKRKCRIELSDQDRARIRQLARDLPKVWRAASTCQSDRKAMLRLAIEAISLRPVDVPRRSTLVRVAWKSGAVTELEVPRPSRHAPDAAVQRIRELAAAALYDTDIAKQLNAEGFVAGSGRTWTDKAVRYTRTRDAIASTAPHPNGAPPLPDQRDDGLYSLRGAAKRFGVSVKTVRKWARQGLLCVQRQPHPHYPHGILWVEIDEATDAKLKALARQLPHRSPRPAPQSPARRLKLWKRIDDN